LVKIISDGTPDGTTVLVDGKPLTNVESCSWVQDPERITAFLILTDVELEAQSTEVEIEPG
jgi:hypothetical protein